MTTVLPTANPSSSLSSGITGISVGKFLDVQRHYRQVIATSGNLEL